MESTESSSWVIPRPQCDLCRQLAILGSQEVAASCLLVLVLMSHLSIRCRSVTANEMWDKESLLAHSGCPVNTKQRPHLHAAGLDWLPAGRHGERHEMRGRARLPPPSHMSRRPGCAASACLTLRIPSYRVCPAPGLKRKLMGVYGGYWCISQNLAA